MTYDEEKCKGCMRRDFCKDGLVECNISDSEVDVTTDCDSETVTVKPSEENNMIEEQIFQAERDRILNRIDEEKEAFCKRWLVSRGWDGTEEHARKLSEGWTIRQQFKDGVLTFKMVTLPRIEEDGGNLFYLDNRNKINLTKLFGKGNEPKAVEEFARIYPIAFLDYGSLT